MDKQPSPVTRESQDFKLGQGITCLRKDSTFRVGSSPYRAAAVLHDLGRDPSPPPRPALDLGFFLEASLCLRAQTLSHHELGL